MAALGMPVRLTTDGGPQFRVKRSRSSAAGGASCMILHRPIITSPMVILRQRSSR
ncbi:Uncharacterized protein FKW44_010304 [Caligus rogercresseyi]|uniref:Uncharacterized protein n=1 Tax=Caligus rogercresseyi TaxID=217165 RepID=A0A7T8K828_CALRO|nr:Uncharacterized protein FKW44_010304 [Caligus rogercresseyi]